MQKTYDSALEVIKVTSSVVDVRAFAAVAFIALIFFFLVWFAVPISESYQVGSIDGRICHKQIETPVVGWLHT